MKTLESVTLNIPSSTIEVCFTKRKTVMIDGEEEAVFVRRVRNYSASEAADFLAAVDGFTNGPAIAAAIGWP
jgi:hypothetical protein